MKGFDALGLVCVVLAGFSCLSDDMNNPIRKQVSAPIAAKVSKVDTVHGDSREDPYYWLREKTNPEVVSYLESEDAYTDAMMSHTLPSQEVLYREMVGRIKETDLSVPYRRGEYWYYSRTEEGKQYPIHARKHGAMDDVEEVTLDLNELAEGQEFLQLWAYDVSDDASLLLYTTDVTGFREYTLHVRDLMGGKTLSEAIPHVVEAVWAGDSRNIFYIIEDDAKRAHRVYRHAVGTAPDGSADELVYEENDELYGLSLTRSLDDEFVFVTSASSTTTEVRYIPATHPDQVPHVVLPRETDHEYHVLHRSGLFYIRSNKDASTFRIVTAPVGDPAPSNWTEFVPHNENVTLEGLELFENHGVVLEREDGLQNLRVIDLESGNRYRIDFPDPVYSVFPTANREFATVNLRFRYQSLVKPASIFEFDMNDRDRTLLKETEVLGGFASSDYDSKRIYVTAPDGVQIPVSMVYRKDMEPDGSNPTLLYAYGSYGVPLSLSFSSVRLSLLDRGVIYAMAHVRGGGDMGKKWHDAGKMMSKRITFTDFIAVAEHMIEDGYTSTERLVINGGSAGGLLTTAVTNMRPELFRAVVSNVPFVDVLNSMLDETLPLTIGEYLEWGNPHVAEEYTYMKSYCPYTNIESKNYPTMLVRTSFNDSQVMYWESAKYVARLRDLKTDENLVLLKINMTGGHGGSSGRYDTMRDLAFDYAFILNQLGMVR
jgi:oligopeptidase B